LIFLFTAFGFGKVYIKYSPRKDRRISKAFGIIVYPLFALVVLISVTWKRPWFKSNGEMTSKFLPRMFTLSCLNKTVTLPILRTLYCGGYRLSRNYSVFVNGFMALLNSDTLNNSQINTLTTIILEDSKVCNFTTHSLYLQGYHHARDRSYQMEVKRKMAFGRLSEMIGNKSIHMDHMVRLLDIPRLSKDDLEYLEDEDITDLKAYAAGVNQYFKEVNYYLPHCAATFRNIKLDPWEPIHSIAILRLLAYEWSSGWESKLLSFQLARKYPNMMKIDASSPANTAPNVEGVIVLESLRGTAISIAGFRSSTQSSFLGSSFSTLVRFYNI